MKKTTLIATALVSSLAATSAFAWWGEGDDQGHRGSGSGYDNCSSSQQGEHGMKGRGGKHARGGSNMQENMNRTLTADEVKTVQEAKLIYMNNPNVKIGEVKANDTGYEVTIVTKKENSLVETIDVAKNGMRLDRYNMVQQRMKTVTPAPASTK